MLDHVGFAVADAERSRLFYEAALAPLGISLIMSVTPEQTESGGTAHGFGSDGKPYFWFGDNEAVGEGTHVAFAAETRDEVDAFYEAALAAGGRDNGAPGLRPHYHPNYYGAFVLDPDGLNIEAVCHKDLQHDREAHLHHRL
ncbi:MAG TPA: VOC family protein [Allosphingosinicella sp.]|nr:VOC family protein [Allosphingosinicella sp.]